MRCLSLTALFALSIAIPNLSPQCGLAGEKPTHDADTPKETKAKRPPFDLTYLPPDAMGVIAIRPSVILSDPAMKPLAGMANEELAQLRQFLKLSGEPELSIEDIEEIIAFSTIKPGDKKHGHNHSLMAGLTMIRATHDFDWLKLMRQIDPKTEEARHKDRVYYRSHFAILFRGISGISPNATFCYFMPDERTVAFLQEKTLSAFVNGQSVQRPHFSWDEDWKRVARGLIAVAMDNRWTCGLSKEQIGGDLGLASLVQQAATMIAGVDWKEGIDFRAYLRCKDPASAKQVTQDVKTLIAGMGQLQAVKYPVDPASGQPKAVAASEPHEVDPASLPPGAALCMQFWKDLVKHVRVRQRESTIRIHTTAKLTVSEFVKILMIGPEQQKRP